MRISWLLKAAVTTNGIVTRGSAGRPVTNSRNVAAYFKKNHADVLRDIDNLMQQMPGGGVRNFAETPYVHPQNGQTYRSFDMDRDGFTLLAMGFTGPSLGTISDFPATLAYLAPPRRSILLLFW